MRYNLILSLLAIICISILVVGCEKTLDKGKVSFATNTGIVNCPIDAYLFIDNIKYGVIPDIGDSSRDCNSSSNLNLELPIGKHKFKVEMKGISGSCASDTTGFINIIKDECTLVFIDITKLTK